MRAPDQQEAEKLMNKMAGTTDQKSYRKTCRECGRELKITESRKRGIGPTCRDKHRRS